MSHFPRVREGGAPSVHLRGLIRGFFRRIPPYFCPSTGSVRIFLTPSNVSILSHKTSVNPGFYFPGEEFWDNKTGDKNKISPLIERGIFQGSFHVYNSCNSTHCKRCPRPFEGLGARQALKAQVCVLTLRIQDTAR